MKHCKECNVDVAGDLTLCPLCQNKLTPVPGKTENVFPNIPTIYRQHNMFFKILIFASFVCVSISAALNIILPESGIWAHFVLIGVACFWIILSVAIRKRKNIPKNILYQVFLVSVIFLLWDWFTGWKGWSLDFAVPIVCLTAIAAMWILSFVLKWKFENQLVYFCIVALFGIVPVISLITGFLSVPYPSIICVTTSEISLAAMIVFNGGSIWEELKRRLHL